MSKTALFLKLAFEIFKAIKQAEKEKEIEKIKKDPNSWLSGHFGRMRERENDKTDAANN